MAPCRASLLTLFVGVLLVNLMAVTQSVGEGVPTPQCHIVPLLGEGNHKGLPLHYITVCRGNPTCKALKAQVQKRMKITAHALHRAGAWEREKMLIKSGYF
ncbi:MAG: hypothetical protein B6247_01610 [Candidatus Parabeggiatoa sp. nov. 2]|nr:MAG: hypothetical protein B6247_01610 [Beggiatoa sp. 4572_84]